MPDIGQTWEGYALTCLFLSKSSDYSIFWQPLTDNQSNPALPVLMGAWHQRSSRVIDNCYHIDVDVLWVQIRKISSKFKIAISGVMIRHTRRLSMASLSNWTTSCPSTPLHLNPLVHWVSRAEERPSCLQGKLNVKPNGILYLFILRSDMNEEIHAAMWSNS